MDEVLGMIVVLLAGAAAVYFLVLSPKARAELAKKGLSAPEFLARLVREDGHKDLMVEKQLPYALWAIQTGKVEGVNRRADGTLEAPYGDWRFWWNNMPTGVLSEAEFSEELDLAEMNAGWLNAEQAARRFGFSTAECEAALVTGEVRGAFHRGGDHKWQADEMDWRQWSDGRRMAHPKTREA